MAPIRYRIQKSLLSDAWLCYRIDPRPRVLSGPLVYSNTWRGLIDLCYPKAVVA